MREREGREREIERGWTCKGEGGREGEVGGREEERGRVRRGS